MAASREDPLASVRPLLVRWEELRAPLNSFAVAGHSLEGRVLARKLDAAVSNSLTSTSWWLTDLAEDADSVHSGAVAKSDYIEAKMLLERYVEIVRSEEG